MRSAPPTWRVTAPQRCVGPSHGSSHASHCQTPCTVAPSTESSAAPANPTAVHSAIHCHAAGPERGAKAETTAPISAPPAAEAAKPKSVTPPDAPGRTLRQVAIERGALGDSAPSSVAHVSAVATAIAPTAAASHRVDAPVAAPANTLPAIAHAAAAPPFASTCAASRVEPL